MTKRNLPYNWCIFISTFFLFCSISPFLSAQKTAPLSMAEQSFEQLWGYFSLHYPSFQAKGVDWEEKYETFRPMVTDETTDQELFQVMSEMLSFLEDGQVSLQKGEVTFTAASPSAFAQTFTTPALQKQWTTNQVKSLIKEGFDVPMVIRGDNYHPVLSYSRSGRFGYLRIHRFSGLSEGKIKKHIQGILKEMENKEGIIVDVRCNPGGSDKIAYLIANYFADEKRVGHYEKPLRAFQKRKRELEPMLLTPPTKGPNFTSSVILLTNEETKAAAEVFALAMRRLPHVTTVGAPTHGIFSGQIAYELVNGWTCQLPYQKHFSSNIVSYEGRGLPVDLLAPSTREDLSRQMDSGIQKALGELRIYYTSKNYELEVK